ncbi:MAG: ABC transporter ATP-binding protein [Candidatus Omnitrophica bacterium]|nr:ABC transporter ATP-binding protein [Candidatus Omnitrophota bacterium]
MNAIEIQQLKKTYANGTQALKEINFSVKQGDFCALLGANGAGKTTIIGIMTGLVNKSSGHVLVNGYDVEADPFKARMSMGVVPQEMNFNMFEKVQDIIINQAGFFGIPKREAQIRSERLLKQLDLWEKRNTQSRQLSGGMKRRLMIARALINAPKLLILDEPTAGVDVELRHSMWDFIRELNQQGTTILLTTHYLEEVEQMCRNAAMIKNGEIIAFDRVKNLLKWVEDQTYVVHVDQIINPDKLELFKVRINDEHTFEVSISKEHSFNDLMRLLNQLNMHVIDLRPKGNRMEQLFLRLLKQ